MVARDTLAPLLPALACSLSPLPTGWVFLLHPHRDFSYSHRPSRSSRDPLTLRANVSLSLFLRFFLFLFVFSPFSPICFLSRSRCFFYFFFATATASNTFCIFSRRFRASREAIGPPCSSPRSKILNGRILSLSGCQ